MVIAAISYLGVACLFLMTDFGDRGFYFTSSELAASTEDEPLSEEDYELRELSLLNRSVGYIRSHYVEPSRVIPKNMLVGALTLVQQTIAEVLVVVERDDNGEPLAVQLLVDRETLRIELQDIHDLYEMTWRLKDALIFMDTHLPSDVPRGDVEYAAVNGMLDTLDPHSVLLEPRTYTQMQVGTSGRFGGLGIVISTRGGDLTIMTVLPGTPAYRGGLKNLDRIAQIGDESTINMTLNDAVNRLRGEVDTEVEIQVLRKGWDEPRAFTIMREIIVIDAVQHTSLSDGIGFVKIKNFQQNTFRELNEALTELKDEGALTRGLVIDLRDDPGGLLDQAVQISDLFLNKGTIVTTVGGGARIREEKKATRRNTLARVPIAVLVNSGSASASEIVTGALKNNDRAVVLGEQTFGKGTVQVFYELEDPLHRIAGLKLTIAQYLTPGDESIQSIGIVPDVVMYPVILVPEALDLHVSPKDLSGEKDPEDPLANEREKAGMNAHVLRYYDAEIEKNVRENAALDEGQVKPEVDEEEVKRGYNEIKIDYPIRFAKRFLLIAGDKSRKTMLERATGLLKEEEKEQEEHIHSRLTTEGIDWRSGEGTSTLRATLAPIDEDGNALDRPIEAGEKLRLRASLTNTGTSPLHRVRALSESDYPRLDNREWIFGRLDPGETRFWDVIIRIPRNARSREVPVTIRCFSDEIDLKSSAELWVKTRARTSPRFAMTWQLRDQQSGNGDGLLQMNENVELVVTLHNVGAGAAHKIRAPLKNLSFEGAFLSSGTGQLEGLAPGESGSLVYAFRAQDKLSKGVVELELDIIETVLRSRTRFSIQVPVMGADGQILVPGTSKVRALKAVALHAGASSSSHIIASTPAESILETNARRGDWLRGVYGDNLGAWIHTTNTAPVSSGEATQPVPLWSAVSPEIILEKDSRERLQTDARTFSLQGAIHFAASEPTRRDFYIYRNDEKIHFQSGPVETSEAIQIPFALDIPLEDGVNTITLYARSGHDLYSQEQIIVYHRSIIPTE